MTERIVVGVDGSESSRAALRWAVADARARGAEVDAVMVWHHPYVGVAATYGMPPLDDVDLGGAARATLDDILRSEGMSASGSPPVNAILVEGPPASTLLEAAKGADLLVVGSRGRGGFKGMLLGSVSLHCVSHAECPVVVIRDAAEDA